MAAEPWRAFNPAVGIAGPVLTEPSSPTWRSRGITASARATPATTSARRSRSASP